MSRQVNTTSSTGKQPICGDSFAQRLRSAMDDTTSEAFARKLNVSLRTVQRWRAGSNEPSGADVIAIADALGVDPRDLFPPSQEAA